MNKPIKCSNSSNCSSSSTTESGNMQLAQVVSLTTSSFDSKHWRQQIEIAINNAMEQDQGALGHCSHYRPDLHRDSITASRALDDTYSTKDAKQIRQAIRLHDKACEATRHAAQNPLKTDKLTSDECAGFCLKHQQRQDKPCPYKNQLDGCILWQAKNLQTPIDQLELAPESYLDLHHKK